MTNLKKNIKGFTLIEVIIVTSIATLIIGTLTGALVSMTKSYELNQNIVDLQYQAQVTLNTLVEEIKYSKGIIKVYKQPDNGDISGNMDREDVSMLCIKNDTDKYTYFKLDGNKLYYKQTTDATLDYTGLDTAKEDLMATNIKAMTMTSLKGPFNETDSVNITLTFQEGDAELTVSNQATIRNKE